MCGWLQTAEPTALLEPTTANLKAVTDIDYDAKGQRLRIEYNEAAIPSSPNIPTIEKRSA